jgi:uncharacterized protein
LLLVGAGLLLRKSGLLPDPGTPGFLAATLGFRLAVVVAALWLVGRLIDRRGLRGFGLTLDRDFLADLGFGLVLGATMMSLVFAVEWSAGFLVVTDTLHSAVAGVAFVWAIWTPAFVFLCVGIVEELLFRGYLLRNLAEGLGFARLGGPPGGLVVACLLSSLLFAAGHADNPNASWVSTLNIAVAGVFLALGYLLSGRLGLPIGLHITWNFFQGSVFGFPVSGVTALGTSFVKVEHSGPEIWTGGAFGPEGGLVGLLAMVIGSGLTLAWYRLRLGRVRLADELFLPSPPPGRPDRPQPP